MSKINKAGFLLKVLPFILAPLFLSACASSSGPLGKKDKKQILHDVLVFRDLKQVDLNNDGTKDIIAIYSTNSDESGVKVIMFHDNEGDVIYERSFSNPPGVRLTMDGDTPMLIVERTNEDTGHKLKDTYRWNGKSFMLVSQ